MKYLIELTESQMDVVRSALGAISNREVMAGALREVTRTLEVIKRAPLVPDECLCALGPVSDDLCPVHDADDLGFDSDEEYSETSSTGQRVK